MGRVARTVFVVLFAGGWTLPLYLSLTELIHWNEAVRRAGSPARAMAENSFPFLELAQQMADVACLWAFLVAAAGGVAWHLRHARSTRSRGDVPAA